MDVTSAEMARRIKAIRQAMEEERLPVLIVYSTTELCYKGAARYVAGYRLSTRKEYVVLPFSGDPVVIVPTIGQQYWAQHTSWINDVRAGGETEGMIGELARSLRDKGLDGGGDVGIVNLRTALPLYDYELLRAALPQANLRDSTDLLDGIRMTKSEEEIGLVRETTEIADGCYDILLERLRPGIEERSVMGEIYRHLAEKGVQDILILTARGHLFPSFISYPGSHLFEKGDHYVFSVEIAGPSGYWSQIVRPFSLGPPSPVYEELFLVGKAAMEKGLELLAPGKRAGDVARVIGEDVRKAGYKTGIWCGHGMGTDLGDGFGLSEENDLELKPGMIVTVHPHVMSGDGKVGLLFGDTFVLREGGAENLSRTPCELKRL